MRPSLTDETGRNDGGSLISAPGNTYSATERGRRSRSRAKLATHIVGSVTAVLLPLAGLAIMIGAWWLVVIVLDMPRVILPAPDDVLYALLDSPSYLLVQGQVTLIETVTAFGITAVGGVAVGTAIASSLVVERMISPWLVAFNAVPKVALAPLLVVWLGFSMTPRIVMAILMCFFPIVLATIAGLTKLPSELVDLARSLDASRVHTFTKLRMPNAMPQIFVGLKVAMPLALIGAVIGEFRGNGGLGQVVVRAGGSGDAPLAFAAIVVLSAMSVLLFYLLVLVERLTIPWVRATTS